MSDGDSTGETDVLVPGESGYCQNLVLCCATNRSAGRTKPFRESKIFSRRRSPFKELAALSYSPVFTPRRPNAERLFRRMIAARGRVNHTRSYMLRGEEALVMRDCLQIATLNGVSRSFAVRFTRRTVCRKRSRSRPQSGPETSPNYPKILLKIMTS